jgi:uncharacterized protein
MRVFPRGAAIRDAVLVWAALPFAAGAQATPAHDPVIDVHLHVYASDPRWTARLANPITGTPMTATDEESHRRAVMAQLHRYNVVAAVASGPWATVAPVLQRLAAISSVRFVPGAGFDGPADVTTDWIRAEHRAGRLAVIGEIAPPFAGYSAGDSVYEPFFALAEELDVPIAVHVGTAAGGATYNGSPKYRMELNRPLRLEDMLARHPRARVQMMHGGWPFADETVALMRLHPQVYADLGVIAWTQSRAEFHAYLRRLVDAGFGKRIMFGSDEMVWPETIGLAIDAVDAATFLSREEKRDIFCRNAARFLKLAPSPCD